LDQSGTAPEADVVHQHVDAAEAPHGVVDDLLNAVRATDVSGDGEDAIGSGNVADLACRLEQSPFCPRTERDEAAFRRQRSCARVPKTTAPARGDRAFAREVG